MMDSQLRQRLYQTLLKCNEFDTNSTLQAVFVSGSLTSFQKDVREADTRDHRVSLMIKSLEGQRTATGQSVLAIFLEELSTRYAHDDLRHAELAELAAHSRTPPSQEPSDTKLPPVQCSLETDLGVLHLSLMATGSRGVIVFTNTNHRQIIKLTCSFSDTNPLLITPQTISEPRIEPNQKSKPHAITVAGGTRGLHTNIRVRIAYVLAGLSDPTRISEVLALDFE